MDCCSWTEAALATNPIDREKKSKAALGEEGRRIRSGVSPQARAILEAALAHRPNRSLFEILASMPNVGEDSDFARHRD
jgi:hypothetical protein